MNQKVTLRGGRCRSWAKRIYNEQTMQVIIDFLDKHKTSNYDWF